MEMGRRTNLSQATIIRILTLWEAGFPIKALAEETGVSRRSVERWLKAAREEPSGIIPFQRKPPGKPFKVPLDTLMVLKQQLEENPGLTAREVKEVNPQLLASVSERTVCRYIKFCKEMSDESIPKIHKLPLVDKHMALRYAFAKKYKNLSIENVRTILWSDEETFLVTGITSVGGPRDSDGSDRSTMANMKQQSTVTVWGSFSYYGLGKLIFLEDGVSLNGLRYLEMLYDNLADCFDTCKAKVFQQDCVPYHTNRCVLEWLYDCRIDYLPDWPPNSPDLNLMEDIWNTIRIELLNKDTRSLSKLKESLATVWANLSHDLLRKLVDSFPGRLREVIRNRGGIIIRQKLDSDGLNSLGTTTFRPGTSTGIPAPRTATETSSEMTYETSSDSSERELLYDENLDLEVEIKEEVVDDTPDFVEVENFEEFSKAEASFEPREDDMQVSTLNVLETRPSISMPSISASRRKVNPSPSRTTEGDEFHLFGMFVASQLRALPLRDALQTQLEIQTILAQKRSQKL